MDTQTQDVIFPFLVANKWEQSRSEKLVDIIQPKDGQVAGRVPAMTQDEVNNAIQLAHQAQTEWRNKSVQERAELLYRWADALEEMQDEIAQMILKEVGKPFSSAKGEVERSAQFIRYTAEEGIRIQGDLIHGDKFPGGTKNKFALVDKEPLGVVLAISPFNYPVNLSVSKIAPALIAGNTVIFKPATQGALSGLLVMKALVKAGLPESVVNTVTGKGSEIGDYIVTHEDIDMISFTGGTQTGQNIAQKASMTSVALELGGKDPAVVLDDADIEKAASMIVSGGLSYSGQRCTAIKRIIVKDSVADALIERIEKELDELTVGPADEGNKIVPLISTKAADYVDHLISDAKQNGAVQVYGGEREGNLIYPTLIDHVQTDMALAFEEQFGPVLPVIRVSDESEAVEIANQSNYGLQASLFTENLNHAFQISRQLEVGTVQLNGKPERGPDHFPFLGVKSSGMGVQGVHRSIESMLRDKVTVVNV